jgi:hypothetical protein
LGDATALALWFDAYQESPARRLPQQRSSDGRFPLHLSHTTQLANLQRQFVEGKHTDIVIRIRVGEQQQPAAKRRRTTEEDEEEGDAYRDIQAHSLVLRTRSPYFDKSLDGEWAEAAARRVELTVPDQQAAEDLKLLIELSYLDSYVLDDGEQLLPLDTRVRLAVRADSLEFVEAVDQIVESLPLELDFEGAIKC